MIAVNEKIIVRVDMKQKNFMKIGNTIVKTAHNFGTNYRERSPVVGQIVSGNKLLKEDQIAVFHHNHFYPPSPYHLQDDLYGVPFNQTIFGILDNDILKPICGNILGHRVCEETFLPVPVEHQKLYIDRIIVEDPGWTKYKKGQLLFIRPHSYYEIIYSINSVEYKIHKVHEDMVVGCVK